MGGVEPIRPGHVPSDVFPGFVDSTPDFAICALDRNGSVSSWNPGAERIKGWRAAEIIGKHFSVFYPPTDVANRKPQYVLQRAMQDGRFEDEGWRVRKDGSSFWANVIVTPVRAPDGTLRGFVKVTRDLTERKHAEDARRVGEERYRLIVESVKDYAIYVLDTSGHILSWNAGAERLKGYTADEVIGRHFSLFYSEEDRAREHPAEEMRLALRDGRYEEEGWRYRKDGTRFWARVTLTALFDDQGRHVGFAKVTRDLTETKRYQEEIQARARSYQEINRELDAFSQTVAHDLRSPIRAVEHLSSVLLEEEAPRLTEEGKETLRALHSSSLNMARLVQDLLDLSTAAGREPVRKDVDITRLTQEVFGDLAKHEPKRNVELVVAPGLRARADQHLVGVALTNLLGNALKFTRRAANPRIEVGAVDTPSGRAFYVRDNGVGFDPAKAARLFQPFTRLVPSTEFEGTGIGLATVRRVVTRHGGEVWAEARPDEGATFYFTLPEARP